MEEASISDSPHKIRELFATQLVLCQVSDPLLLWKKHQDSLSDDVKRQLEKKCKNAVIQLRMDIVYDKCLALLEDMVFAMSGNLLQHYGLPKPSRHLEEIRVNREYLRQTSYD